MNLMPTFVINGVKILPKTQLKVFLATLCIIGAGWLLFSIPLSSSVTSTQTATSNVTVNSYLAITITSALSGGIQFGSLNPNTADNPTSTCASLACNISVSADSNVNVDIMLKANAPLTRTAGGTIGYGNYTWNDTDATVQPIVTGSTALSGTYTSIQDNNVASAKRAWDAFLDVPSGQTAGVYNNTLSFCGEEAGTSDCT